MPNSLRFPLISLKQKDGLKDQITNMIIVLIRKAVFSDPIVIYLEFSFLLKQQH